MDQDQDEDMFSETKNIDRDEENSIGSWQEYLDIFSAAHPSSRQEEEEFNMIYYDENYSDPTLFLNANTP